ncbi:META domain-containing protein [Seonamhaeicola sp. ML3]|uniref:META domain-containing protein n=1 Tax=Seonamhaeicola sp. ML3 TaxID=2937786 RepID=UPI00201026DB|nr:META domain-containing protein [Seonamhaeicola sp. ML3]
MKWILMLFSVMALKTCDNSNGQKQNTMLNDTFNITTLNGNDVSEFNLNITFNDSTKQVSGFSGCNRFFGSFGTIDNGLRFGPIGSTRMMCSPKFNDVESKMLDALSKVNLFSVKGDTLIFSNGDRVLMEATKQDLAISLEYNQHSRNSFQVIQINEKSISVQNERNGSITKMGCTDEQWDKLINLIKTINIETLSSLDAPSQKRLFDGAAIAKLKVTLNGKTYETPSFDHGNPNTAITNLVKEILSIAQNIE